jgi:predicted flap endonuclease-1-like 5' DNA nuclease
MSLTSTPPTETRTPTVNDVYEESRNRKLRNRKLRRVIYKDGVVVLLRCEEMSRDGEQHIHNMVKTTVFKKRIENGRLEYKPDLESDIPKADPHTEDSISPSENEPASTEPNQASIDQSTITSGDVETDSPSESVETSSSPEDAKTDSVESSSTSEQNEEPWSDISGIGPQTEENLYNSGYTTKEDIYKADDEALENEIDNLGKVGISRLNDYCNNS